MQTDTLEFLLGIEGWFAPEEGERLGELAAAVPADQAIIELGSYAGRSSCWMAASGGQAHITCIDPWTHWDHPDYPHIDDGGLAAFRRNMEAGGWGNRVTPLRSTSEQVAAMWVQPVGLLFIDTVHEYDWALSNFSDWAPHVVPGGVVAFHDCSDAFPGIGEAVTSILEVGNWEDLGLVTSLRTIAKRP